MVVGCMRFFINSFARRRSSAAIRTTDVVPSPTYFLVRYSYTLRSINTAHLLILLLGQVHQDLARRVIDIEETKDGRAIIGDSDILETSEPFKHGFQASYPDIIHHHLVEPRGAE